MPLRYKISRIGPTRFRASPAEELPSWEFDIPDWAVQDASEIISEADMRRPCNLTGEGGPDMSDVMINFILADDLGSSSMRS